MGGQPSLQAWRREDDPLGAVFVFEAVEDHTDGLTGTRSHDGRTIALCDLDVDHLAPPCIGFAVTGLSQHVFWLSV